MVLQRTQQIQERSNLSIFNCRNPNSQLQSVAITTTKTTTKTKTTRETTRETTTTTKTKTTTTTKERREKGKKIRSGKNKFNRQLNKLCLKLGLTKPNFTFIPSDLRKSIFGLSVILHLVSSNNFILYNSTLDKQGNEEDDKAKLYKKDVTIWTINYCKSKNRSPDDIGSIIAEVICFLENIIDDFNGNIFKNNPYLNYILELFDSADSTDCGE
jgi:hypothetical protein